MVAVKKIYIRWKGNRLNSEDPQTRKMDHEEIKRCFRGLLTDYLLAHVILARFLFFIVQRRSSNTKYFIARNTRVILRLADRI